MTDRGDSWTPDQRKEAARVMRDDYGIVGANVCGEPMHLECRTDDQVRMTVQFIKRGSVYTCVVCGRPL